MRNKVYLIILFFISIKGLFSIDLSVHGGYSTFNYTEISENLKEDRYTINSAFVGAKVKKSLSKVEILAGASFHRPYEILFKDLYGDDPANYLMGMYFYGLNCQVGALYPVLNRRVKFSVGALFNFDFFYFRDQQNNIGAEYYYSVLGNGLVLDLSYNVNKWLLIGLNSSFNINYLPIHQRGEEFKWSNNFIIGPYLSLVL